ncbi:hypothetical protein HK104_009824 [Borealophlyctis nickersoniae]|nr:hypothetical protein HK104_009824 [Borealophlyctis nickersoniae]
MKVSGNVLSLEDLYIDLLGPLLGPNQEAVADHGWMKLNPTSLTRGFIRMDQLEYYTPIIMDTCDKALAQWAERGSIANFFTDASEMLTEINIRCFLGDEFASKYSSLIAPAYQDIEDGWANPFTTAFRHQINPEYAKVLRARALIAEKVTEEVERRFDGDVVKEEYKNGRDYLQVMINMAYLARVRKDLADPTANAASRYEFINAAIKETGRIFSPHMLIRRVRTDIEVDGGRVIKAGEKIIVPPFHHYYDGKIFPDPEAYKAERWLDTDYAKSVIRSGAFPQFGAGPHKCFGEKFAHTVIHTCMARMVMNYDFELTGSGADKQADGSWKIKRPSWNRLLGTLWIDEPIAMKVARRKEPVTFVVRD